MIEYFFYLKIFLPITLFRGNKEFLIGYTRRSLQKPLAISEGFDVSSLSIKKDLLLFDLFFDRKY